MANRRPVVFFRSRGATGNIYAILGAVRMELRRLRRINDYNMIYDRVMNCHSYADALAIIRETVDLIDEDRLY